MLQRSAIAIDTGNLWIQENLVVTSSYARPPDRPYRFWELEGRLRKGGKRSPRHTPRVCPVEK